jgi:hypothetical protein
MIADWEGNDDWPLATGMIMGLAMKYGIPLVPVTDEEGYTNRFEVVHPDLPKNLRIFLNVEKPRREPSE